MKKKSFFKRKFSFINNSAFTLVEISVVVLIIGILLAGISQVFEMISETSLKSARSLSKSSRITRTDDLVFWLDATSDKAFDKEKDDNSTVSIWKDTNPKSTSPISSTSSSASLYPSYSLSAINSLPAVKFKKTSSTVGNCITIPSESFVNNSEDFTLYLTYSPTTLDDGIIIEKNNASATSFPFSLELSSGFYKFSVKNSTSTISVIGSRQAKINTPNLIRLSRTKGSQIEISINGVSSTQSDTLASSTFNNAELSIGCRNGATSPANFINGNIGETTFFNRNLSVKEKTEIEEYLYKKWKMKKYEGALTTQEFVPCAVPSNINADTAITSVQPTSSAQIGCKEGFNGSINYKCNAGVFSALSNSCAQIKCDVPSNLNSTQDGLLAPYTLSPLPLTCKSGYYGTLTYTCNASRTFSATGSCGKNCTIPSTANTTVDNSSVASTSTSVALTCKTGYTGTVNYTCSNDGILSMTGTCNPLTCTYTETQSSGTSKCLNNLNETMTFNVGDSGTMLCPYYSWNNAGSYANGFQDSARDMRYKCNSDGTLLYDVRPRCYSDGGNYAVFNSYRSGYGEWVNGKSGQGCTYGGKAITWVF